MMISTKLRISKLCIIHFDWDYVTSYFLFTAIRSQKGCGMKSFVKAVADIVLFTLKITS